MSETPLAEQAIRFHPSAVRPRFVWTMHLPNRWAFLDTHPEVWSTRVDRIIDEFYLGRRLRAAEKRTLRNQLTSTVQAAQKNGIAMVFLLPGSNDDGEVVACTILVRWQSSAPQSASLTAVESAFSASKSLERRSSPSGAAYALFSETTKVGPWAQQRSMWNTQAFVPVPTTSWTLVLSGSAPSAEQGDAVREMVIHMAGSLRSYPDETGRLLADDENGDTTTAEPGLIRADGEDAVRTREEQKL